MTSSTDLRAPRIAPSSGAIPAWGSVINES
jgi:hypothetical protein